MRVLFKLRRNKRDPDKQATIYCRIKLNGEHANDFSTFIKVMPEKWDSKNQKILGTSREVEDDNETLSDFKAEARRLLRKHDDIDRSISAQGLSDLLTGKHKLNYTFKELVEQFQKVIKATYDSPGTKKNYGTRFTNILLFLKEKKLEHLPADRFTLGRADEFVRWAQARKLDHEYIIRHTQILKNITEDAVRREITPVDTLAVFRLKKRGKVNTKHLSLAEIEQIAKFDGRPVLKRTADLFLFSIYTGLHYQDVQTLQASEIREGIDGRTWLIKPRGKYAESKFFTGEMVQLVPLRKEAEAIIERYGGPEKLPKMSNAGYNSYLKDIQADLEIKLNLTVKIARKTFTDVMLNELGISEESVAAMLGHNTTKHVRYYGRASERRVAKEVIYE